MSMERAEQIAMLRSAVTAIRRHPNNMNYLFLTLRKEYGYGPTRRMIREVEAGGEFAERMAKTATALHRFGGTPRVITTQDMVDVAPKMTKALNRITYGRVWQYSPALAHQRLITFSS